MVTYLSCCFLIKEPWTLRCVYGYIVSWCIMYQSLYIITVQFLHVFATCFPCCCWGLLYGFWRIWWLLKCINKLCQTDEYIHWIPLLCIYIYICIYIVCYGGFSWDCVLRILFSSFRIQLDRQNQPSPCIREEVWETSRRDWRCFECALITCEHLCFDRHVLANISIVGGPYLDR